MGIGELPDITDAEEKEIDDVGSSVHHRAIVSSLTLGVVLKLMTFLHYRVLILWMYHLRPDNVPFTRNSPFSLSSTNLYARQERDASENIARLYSSSLVNKIL